ncbi:MAG: class I SAM-dependent methyltransferase [Clostridiales bacterium]|nr:class I SAM-dependent methyltransferase [Clostridiales bacterium]
MSVRLSARLTALAEMVTRGNRLADVGCDHGYLPIWLCLEDRIPSAIAMDVKPGPLSRAEGHITEFDLTDRIETRLSDGLENLGEDEADTILIAGMGGMLMRRILTDRAIPESVTELVLQPQSDVAEVRRCVREIGFHIVDEDMVYEDGKYYPMMRCTRGLSPEYSELEDEFGPVLLAKKHPVLRQYLGYQLTLTEGILSKLDAQSQRYTEIEHKLLSINLAVSELHIDSPRRQAACCAV